MITLSLPIVRGKLPLGRDASALYIPWIVALIVYVAAMCAIGIVAVADAVEALDRQLATSMTVEIPPEASSARVQTVLGVLRQAHGITAVHELDDKETTRLLEPWLGPSPPLDVLPVPRLIDLRISPGDPPDLATLRQQLASVLPEARLEDHRAGLGELRSSAHRLQLIELIMLLLALGLVATVVIFATQSTMALEHDIVELVHLLGAPDPDVAGQITGRIMLISTAGAAGGALVALFTDWMLGGTAGFLQLPGGSPVLRPADWRLWALLIAAIVVAGIIATVCAQVTVERRLRRLP